MCYVVLVLCVIPLAGCLHAPPAGLTRGVVEIKDTWVWEGDHPGQSITLTNTLTGIFIGEHTVLTVAHTFEDEPESDHPITIDGRTLEYTIIADGWEGIRGDWALEDKPAYGDVIQEDYVLLKTTEPFSDFARLVPLEYERIGEIRNLYLVTRRKDTGEVKAIVPKRVNYGNDRKDITLDLPRWARDGFYFSGSPLIGTYEDGTLVLVGIETSHGDVLMEIDGKQRRLDHQFFILPAYRIPFDLIAEP